LRTIGRENGWVQIVDPATSQQAWIYEKYLSPNEGPGQTQEALPQQSQPPNSEQQPTQAAADIPDQNGISAADQPRLAVKSIVEVLWLEPTPCSGGSYYEIREALPQIVLKGD
jgi:hypothetical protein